MKSKARKNWSKRKLTGPQRIFKKGVANVTGQTNNRVAQRPQSKGWIYGVRQAH